MLEVSHFLAQAVPGDSPNMVEQIALQMGINGPQLVSQIILFSVVLFALAKIAFGPVQKVLAERQKLIEQSLENSEKIRKELSETEASRKEILKKAEEKAAEIIKQAQITAEKASQMRMSEATKEAEQVAVKNRAAMQVERARMEAELRDQIVRLVTEATLKVTGKILTPEDHQRLTNETLSQVSRN